MTLRFGVFDDIEPVPGQRLDQIYRERLVQIERSFQWGDLTHAHAMRSLELFATEVMPRYATRSTSAFADTRTGSTSSTRRPS